MDDRRARRGHQGEDVGEAGRQDGAAHGAHLRCRLGRFDEHDVGGRGGRTPLLPQRNLAEIGYRIVINPNALEETQAMFAPPRVIESRVFARVPAAKLLEGPSFDRAGNLYVVDIPNGRVSRISPKGRVPVAA